MVITRKTSIPMPPASRTTSTQAAPKLTNGKTPQPSVSQDLEFEQILMNGAPSPNRRQSHAGPQFSDDALFSDGSPPRRVSKEKSRLKSKSKKKETRSHIKRKKKSSTWPDLFARVFILAFLIYSLSVCPTADKETSPVCRALSEYRRIVLEPYLIRPVQGLVQHPSVSPYAMPVIDKARPAIARAQHEWNSRIVTQWNALIAPQWERHIVHRWNAYVSPRLQDLRARLSPYRLQIAELYDKHGAPHVQQAQILLHKARPYAVLASEKVRGAYRYSKPIAFRFYQKLQRIPPLTVKYVIIPLSSARRQFVDPHVALLLEKIKELSSGTAKSPETTQDADGLASPAVARTIAKDIENASKLVEVELPSTPTSTSSVETFFSAASIASASLSLGTDVAGSSLTTDQSVEAKTLASASSVLSASLSLGDEGTSSVPGATYSPAADPVTSLSRAMESMVVSVQEKPQSGDSKALSSPLDVQTEDEAESAPTDTDDLPEDTHETPSGLPPLGNIEVPKAHRPPLPVPPPLNSEDDLEELLAELELDVEETFSTEASPTPSIIEETEEEKAAKEVQRLAEVAEKRRELEARHTKWEEKLADAIEAQTMALKDAVAVIRRTGAAELKINLSIRAAIETLHTEAEKVVRGTEAYFTKLKTGGKPRVEQARLWEKVLQKVQTKFDERVQNVEETVNNWYGEEILSKEMQEIEKASDIVRNVADEAQADIGLDYAWLDDVTYMDWRRYHALLDKHQAFLDESMALANGSHEAPYPNIVLDTFQDLQAEVHDITLGFETRMRRIKREGERAFAEEVSVTEVAAPEVSILPITDGKKKEDQVFQDVADVILGRSEEEVTAAFDRAGDKQHKAMHEEL